MHFAWDNGRHGRFLPRKVALFKKISSRKIFRIRTKGLAASRRSPFLCIRQTTVKDAIIFAAIVEFFLK